MKKTVVYIISIAGMVTCSALAADAKSKGFGRGHTVTPKSETIGMQLLIKHTEQLPQEADSFRANLIDPLFATWLDNQYTIQTRLINNIEYDQSLGTGAAARAESELNDLRYMQLRVKEEIAYLRNLPVDDGSVINVLDYGAVGDGITDDGVAIARAIAAVRDSATNTVFFPEGKYFVGKEGAPTNESAHIQLELLNNILLKGGDGVELVFGDPLRAGIRMLDCNNVRLENFSITYRPLPYTLGTVTEEVPNGYTLTIRDGFPSPTEPYFQANDFGGLSRFYSSALFPDSPRPELSNVSSHLASPNVTEVSATKFLFKYDHAIPKHLKGLNVCFQARMFSNMAVEVLESERCRVNDVRVFSSPAMAFLSNGSDMTFINNCYLGPDPEMDTFSSSNADGIFVRDALMGGLISNNSVKYNGDDFFNVHNHTRPAYKIDGRVVYLEFWNEKLLQKGHRLGWIRASVGEKHVSGEAFIEKVEKIDDLYKVTCDRNLPDLVTTVLLGTDPAARPDYLCIMEAKFHGGVVVGNTFRHGLSRFLLGGRNWLFADNVIEDSLSNPYLFTFGPRPMGVSGAEGVQSRNILLERNHLTCRSKTVFSFENVLNPNIKAVDFLTTTHIGIRNNAITLLGLYGDRPFSVVDDASMVKIVGNRIANNCDSIAPAFELQGCGDVVIEGNSITGNFRQLYTSEESSMFTSTNNSFRNASVERTSFKGWDFSRATDIAEWQSNAVVRDIQFLASTNTLRLKITGSDPYIEFPPFSAGTGFSSVVANMRCPDIGSCSIKLYWKTATIGFSEEKSKTFSVGLNPSQRDEFNVYNLLGALHPEWMGSAVTGLRMDMFSGTPEGSVVEVRGIVLTDGPAY